MRTATSHPRCHVAGARVETEGGRLRQERLEFPGASGDRLVGRLAVPADGAPRAYALFAHCFTCSKDLKAAVRLTRELVAARLAVFRFDFTGLGESEGDFADTHFSTNVGDLVAAARFLEREREAPQVLLGHSLGGAAVIHAAGELPAVRAVATIGTPADPTHVKRHLSGSLEEIEKGGEAEISIAGRPFRIRREFLEDLERQNMERALSELKRPLILFHAPRDEVVGIDNAAELYAMARHPKSFVSLDQADHLLTDARDARHVGRVLAAWAERYVEAPRERPGVETDREGGVAARIGAEGFRTDLVAGGHALIADEPEEVGGTDEGPSPYDLLAAALGACTAMTLRMYADRKEWPLEGATVRLSHHRCHAKDDARCAEEDVGLDVLVRRLELQGPLSEEQRDRLEEIADRCPVGRTLESGVRVKGA